MKSLKVEIEISGDTLKNMILVMLLERDPKFISKISRHSILYSASKMAELLGCLNYTDEKINERYGHYSEYADKVKKSGHLLYEYFPEISDEENSIKFIKSLGD